VDVVQSRHGRANRATLQQARNGEAADQRQMFSATAAVSHIDARASWGATSSLSTDMTPPTSSHLPQPGAILAPYQCLQFRAITSSILCPPYQRRRKSPSPTLCHLFTRFASPPASHATTIEFASIPASLVHTTQVLRRLWSKSKLT
jgi:hypothetical protein